MQSLEAKFSLQSAGAIFDCVLTMSMADIGCHLVCGNWVPEVCGWCCKCCCKGNKCCGGESASDRLLVAKIKVAKTKFLGSKVAAKLGFTSSASACATVLGLVAAFILLMAAVVFARQHCATDVPTDDESNDELDCLQNHEEHNELVAPVSLTMV